MFLAKVLVVSDSAFEGDREDLSGPLITQYLESNGFMVVDLNVIQDGVESVASALLSMSEQFEGLIVTTGGTGFSQRDQTPEGTLKVIQRQAPGLAEAMRQASPLGPLSRGMAGCIGSTLIINVPGSKKGAIESIEAIINVLSHALSLLVDPGDPHP
ncbi:MAG: MogA/MoaB family molybdenum cofactor biosynthesis protein [Acidimicrobiales bacterium]|nr:MogA/MoaB family molybdenum cofactor biosynthesis protein [Acidimicrobiales bacterium]